MAALPSGSTGRHDGLPQGLLVLPGAVKLVAQLPGERQAGQHHWHPTHRHLPQVPEPQAVAGDVVVG